MSTSYDFFITRILFIADYSPLTLHIFVKSMNQIFITLRTKEKRRTFVISVIFFHNLEQNPTIIEIFIYWLLQHTKKIGKKRQKQNSLTLLEHLPNELFAQIFSYLNGVDAVFAFSQLNYRFQCLLFDYCQFFDLVFQQHDTPKQIEYFIEN